eukprot:TRINITY_DN7169_c0_g1_i1.p1 TRINITY_DN7169_c0_g1~~TRINITY_DN7169_c0_g1_i1.p1  ORF type:complete len:454 (+),score=89.92 TRINITY_DN7169_c0_g1_i1:16-1377(+)
MLNLRKGKGMPVLHEFNIYLLDNSRSRAYLQSLIRNQLIPEHIYVLYPEDKELPDPSSEPAPADTDAHFFVKNESVFHTLKKNDLAYTVVRNVDLNSPQIVELSKTLPGKYTIYCGGPILGAELLNSSPSKFIHCHPGRTPDFRGSTCFYYSLIAERKMGVSCFFMEVGLDEGDILSQKEFLPINGVDIDAVFDSWMRAETLIDAIKSYVENSLKFTPVPQEGEGETYFIIHPVLKTLAIDVVHNHGRVIDTKLSLVPPTVSVYEYTQQDRIKNPHKYSFSPFGKEFLRLYKGDREKYIGIITAKIQERGISLKDLQELVKVENSVKTPEELRKIAASLLQEEITPSEAEKQLSPWVKKYEVWKKLYTVYNSSFRKASDDCNLLSSYIYASLASLLVFRQTKNLKFLNVALKLNDCICSLIPSTESLDSVSVDLIQHSLQLERESISQLEQEC